MYELRPLLFIAVLSRVCIELRLGKAQLGHKRVCLVANAFWDHPACREVLRIRDEWCAICEGRVEVGQRLMSGSRSASVDDSFAVTLREGLEDKYVGTSHCG